MTRRVYRSTDYGAPALSGTVGALITLLNTVLVTGYGTQTPTSITSSGTTCTVTLPVAHGLYGTAKVTISGCTQTAYNGEFTATITGTNTLTYTALTSPSASPATGAPSFKLAGCGWTEAYTGTNLAAFQTGIGSNGLYFRVDDTNAQYALVSGYETMTAVSTGTGQNPSGGLYLIKSTASSSATRAWVITATSTYFTLWVDTDGLADGTGCVYFYGDITSYKGGDAFGTLIKANSSSSYASTAYSCNATTSGATGMYLARTYQQTGGYISAGMVGDYWRAGNGQLGQGGLTFPHQVDGGLYLSPIWINEASTHVIRGVFPGMWQACHNNPFANGDIVIGQGAFANKVFQALYGYSAMYLLEISDT